MNVTGTVVRGLVLGTVAGVVYVASRRSTAEPPRLIQWDRVRRLADEISRRDADTWLAPLPDLSERYRSMVRQSEDVIGTYLKAQLPLPLDHVEVFDRRQWVDANIRSFQDLFGSLETMNRDALRNATLGTHLFGEVNQTVLSSQLGLLMGYLARKVLGQYDGALLGREPVTTGRLYFVEPNIAMTQRRLNLNGTDFRTWIALHETTHAFEFEAHPWLRDYMNSLLREYFDSVSSDLGRFAFGSGGALGLAQRVVQNATRTRQPLELFMTPEQQALFQKLQALMCLLEGYSNHVMDEVGRWLLPSYPDMKRQFDSRHKDRSIAEQIFTRITGLDLKLEQYVLGEKFVNAQVATVGIDRFNQIFAGPANLPTLAEIYEPERWRDRLGV
jgi:coenzyme F420 biosynthesis associated uncharacterized protein